jgi:hypothetical protein
MKRLCQSCLLVLVAICSLPALASDHGETWRQEAAAVAGQFVGQLKPALQAAMKEGGPVHAIEVCSQTAPRIAEELSVSSGWSLRRVSLKSRNVSAARPDAWERAMLQFFDAAATAGETPQAVGYETDGEYRFLKPQLVGGLCLACHGEVLADDVKAALKRYYPEDTAVGYRPGQVRGAISLRRGVLGVR